MDDLNNIVFIDLNKLKPHPLNPRKNLGDLTELAESLKVKGVLQNLTVVPDGEDYLVIIGHRRRAAAKLAGLKELPCYITEMNEREQQETMLLENMQRADLTAVEQAQGFQLMLDLGSTEKEIAEKTGFSRTTVRHRLELAKLDQKNLQEKEQDPEFQLSLTDLYELERLTDVGLRNQVLKNARNSNQLKYYVTTEIKEQKRKKNADAMIKILKEKGVKELPESMNRYSPKITTILSYDLDKEPLEKFRFKGADPKKCYYENSGYYFYILCKTKDLTKGKKELSQEEIRREEIRKKIEALLNLEKEIKKNEKEYFREIIHRKIKPEQPQMVVTRCLDLIMISEACVWLNSYKMAALMHGCKREQVTVQQKADVKDISEDHYKLLLITELIAQEKTVATWDRKYDSKNGKWIKQWYEVLGQYGFHLEGEKAAVIDGTHELYDRKEEET